MSKKQGMTTFGAGLLNAKKAIAQLEAQRKKSQPSPQIHPLDFPVVGERHRDREAFLALAKKMLVDKALLEGEKSRPIRGFLEAR